MSAFSSCSGEFARAAGNQPSRAPAPEAVVRIPVPAARAAVVSAAVEVPTEAPARPPTHDVTASDAPPTSAGATDDPPMYEPAVHDLEPIVDREHLLVALAKETGIFQRPSFKSPKIGYLRAGAQVRRESAAAGYEGCKLGFYRIMPDGYVCVGPTATLDPDHPLAQFSRVRPDRSAPMPYRYGRSLYPTPPFYTRLPTKAEQEREEPELARHLEANTRLAWRDAPSEITPAFLAAGEPAPTPFGVPRETQLTRGRAVSDSSFALLSVYDQGGRRFGLTTDFSLLPLDRMKPVAVSSFHGIALGNGVQLPVVFVRSKSAFLYAGGPKVGLSITRPLGFREALPITGHSQTIAGVSYLETSAGDWIRDENLVRVDPSSSHPGWAKPGRTWVHVSILKQTLVAYEGDTPVYVTLVSTGADGLGDPKTTHSTVLGQFLIHTKHVTATMDSDEVGDEFDLRDVPYVQYFSEGFAFHAAYWHDTFGTPHSHGCVNLSPMDSRWLFHWTDPPVPQAWHGAMSRLGGTLVDISP